MRSLKLFAKEYFWLISFFDIIFSQDSYFSLLVGKNFIRFVIKGCWWIDSLAKRLSILAFHQAIGDSSSSESISSCCYWGLIVMWDPFEIFYQLLFILKILIVLLSISVVFFVEKYILSKPFFITLLFFLDWLDHFLS